MPEEPKKKDQEAKLHKVLAGFAPVIYKSLKKVGFFDQGKEKPALSATFWRSLKKQSATKNAEAFDIIFDAYSTPALQKGKAEVNKMLGFRQPIQQITRQEAWVDRYYGIRKPKFVELMTRTDMQRVRRLTTDEALDLYGLIDENRYINERDFARALKDSYVCDGDQARLMRCKRTESHFANTSGKYAYAQDVGAQEKRRLTAGDERVREEHAADALLGWIPIDEPYEFSGEVFSGEDSINCRCQDLFRFKKD